MEVLVMPRIPGPLSKFETLSKDQQLQDDLPHLNNVFLMSPYTQSKISTYDYDESWQPLHAQHTTLEYTDGEPSTDVANLIIPTHSATSTRVMVIEDISSILVGNLINLLDISLEVFEEHLLDCDWGWVWQKPTKPDPDSSTWNSRRVGKSHFSMKWWRPYKTNLLARSMSIEDRKLTVRESFDPDEDSLEEDIPELKEYDLAYRVNTWRSHLNFQLENVTWSEQHRISTDVSHGTTLAGEERVTIWQGQYATCQLVIVLMDAGFGGRVKKFSGEDEKVTNQLFLMRHARSKPTLERGNLQSHVTSQSGQKAIGSSANHTTSGEPLLLPPAPQVEPSEGSKLKPGQDCSETHTTLSAVIKKKDEPENTVLELAVPFDAERTSVIRNIASRCPLEYKQLDEARDNSYFIPLTTTREDFGAWVEYAASSKIRLDPTYGVVSLVFKIVHHDTLDFLHLVEKYLNEVISASDDEVEVEKNITLWRKMLGDLDQKLRQIMRTVTPFAGFLSTKDPSSQSRTHDDINLASASQEMIEATEKVRSLLQQTYTLISSSISVAESRRGISEAESVTRLTELAFIYVPLSFAASFFGMQVKELNPDTTSIVGFVGLAIGVVATSYMVRLLIRSRGFHRLMMKMMQSVRHDAGVTDRQPVRTRDFLVWLWHRALADHLSFAGGDQYYSSWLTFLVVFSGMVAMISVWSSANLLPSMKVAISVAAIVMFISFLVFACASNSQSLVDMLRARRRERERRKRQRAKRSHDTGA